MIAENDQKFIWVSPGEDVSGEGSYAKPFLSVSKAVECARPGQTVVLKGGVYLGDVTIQKSGVIDKPLRIIAEKDAEVICAAACWYLYDVSDSILSGIVFRESPGIALSVIGKCERNRFEFLSFKNCGITQKESCTLFLGGSGQACNVVDSCCFERATDKDPAKFSQNISIGLLISEGDYQEGEANCDCIITKNRFVNYGYGILVGSQDSTTGEYGHQVTYNTLDNCSAEGIMVKCGDTLVKGNRVQNCAQHSISVVAGKSSIVEENRIVNCGSGIRIAGKGHTVANNCIVRCQKEAISVLSDVSPEAALASNIIIEQNTCINWGGGSKTQKKQSGVLIGHGTSCIVRKNLFHGPGKPYSVLETGTRKSRKRPSKCEVASCLIDDNISSGGCETLDGSVYNEVAFAQTALDNYDNASGYGAQGWLLKPDTTGPQEQSNGDDAEIEAPDDLSPAGPEEDELPLDEEAPEELEEGEAVFRSFFMHDEDFVASSREGDEGPLFEESEET
jgi:hypothetical protein